MKAPSYSDSVHWIAHNDSPGDDDPVEMVAGLVTVCMVADLFDVCNKEVAHDVCAIRSGEGFKARRKRRGRSE